MNLEQAMKHIVPGALHVIVASRHQDGAVGLFYSRDPSTWLVALSSHAQLDQVEVRHGAASAHVVEQLRTRFDPLHAPAGALPWYLIDFDQATKALGEYDLETGARVAGAAFKLHDRVYVASAGRGVVEGFTPCGRVTVRMEANRLTSRVVHAPRSLVKPIVRMGVKP
jgi:hypothetical protein